MSMAFVICDKEWKNEVKDDTVPKKQKTPWACEGTLDVVLFESEERAVYKSGRSGVTAWAEEARRQDN